MSEGAGPDRSGVLCTDAPPADAPTHLPRALRPLRYRDYRLLACSATASLLADGCWLVALARGP
jgi:hypothetical protein